jgi:hypothetical protein
VAIFTDFCSFLLFSDLFYDIAAPHSRVHDHPFCSLVYVNNNALVSNITFLYSVDRYFPALIINCYVCLLGCDTPKCGVL